MENAAVQKRQPLGFLDGQSEPDTKRQHVEDVVPVEENVDDERCEVRADE